MSPHVHLIFYASMYLKNIWRIYCWEYTDFATELCLKEKNELQKYAQSKDRHKNNWARTILEQYLHQHWQQVNWRRRRLESLRGKHTHGSFLKITPDATLPPSLAPTPPPLTGVNFTPQRRPPCFLYTQLPMCAYYSVLICAHFIWSVLITSACHKLIV